MATESKPIELGTSCPDFQLPATDGTTKSLAGYDGAVLVVGFTCNHCPYVKAYEDRLNALSKSYDSKPVSFVCISANDAVNYPEDSFDEMKRRAQEKEFHFDYLYDETQEVARRFNAACTPEFYVYDLDRKLRYHGRLDDSTHEPEKVKETYLKNAIDDLLGGKSPRLSQTSAIGCGIKWKA